ncbi:putative ribonuclease H-like domain-containing protein [Tanacetum coccineum]
MNYVPVAAGTITNESAACEPKIPATDDQKLCDKDEPEVDLGNITNSYTVSTTPNTRIHKDHPITNVIGDVKSSTEPTSIAKALSDSSWVEAMQEELLQFKLQQVWILVDLPIGKRAIGIKWVFRNKTEKIGIMIRNKARLVAHAYASFMGFLVYQMDVKSAFLYGTIEEKVYVTQPPGFKYPNNPNKVYKVVKALYGLHQAPRAWYETLANYLLGNGYKRGKIDQIFFIKKQKGDILLVQVYVDDIIFSSTNKELCTGFEKLMKDKFQMSSMGELTFFLGLQIYTQTNHNLWDIIFNGDLQEEPAPTGDQSGPSAPPVPKFAKQLASKKNQERMLNLSGLQSNQGLEEMKNLRRCRKIQLEVHGAPISKEDINQKFLRSLPPSWNQIALIMINKPDIDEIDIDDLYNNLRVYEEEMKRSSSSTSTSQNLVFLSSENTSSTNEVRTASGDFGSRRNQGRRSYGDNGRSNAPTNESSSQALVAQDGLGGYD